MISLFKKKVHPPGEYPEGYENWEGYGGCARCYTPWNKTKSHSTYYHSCIPGTHFYPNSAFGPIEDSWPCSGAFPLCQGCWESLAPEQRWPYYEALISMWEGDLSTPTHNGTPWSLVRERLKEAVFKE